MNQQDSTATTRIGTVQKFGKTCTVTDEVLGDDTLLRQITLRLTREVLDTVHEHGYVDMEPPTIELGEAIVLSHEVPRSWWERLLRRKPRYETGSPMWPLLCEVRAVERPR